MANTCCYCIVLRPGTIIITALLFIFYLSFPFQFDGKSTLAFNTVQTSKDGTKIRIPTVIDVSPQEMDYIFAVFLPVVTLAMLLSAIFKKSEILYYALITFIIAYISLTVYSTLGEERGWWFQYKFPPTDIPTNSVEVDVEPKSTSALIAVFGYVIGGYFMYVVYSYVQQLREDIPTSGKVILA